MICKECQWNDLFVNIDFSDYHMPVICSSFFAQNLENHQLYGFPGECMVSNCTKRINLGTHLQSHRITQWRRIIVILMISRWNESNKSNINSTWFNSVNFIGKLQLIDRRIKPEVESRSFAYIAAHVALYQPVIQKLYGQSQSFQQVDFIWRVAVFSTSRSHTINWNGINKIEREMSSNVVKFNCQKSRVHT